MPNNVTTYASEQIINTLYSGALFVSQHTGDPGRTGVAEVTTAQDANYVRRAATFVKSANGLLFQSKNQADVSFPAASAGANYSVTHLAVWSALTNGNCLAIIPLTGGALPVVAGTINTYAANDIVIKGE